MAEKNLVKSVKLPSLKVIILLKTNEDIAAQSRWILQMFVSWPHHIDVCKTSLASDVSHLNLVKWLIVRRSFQ